MTDKERFLEAYNQAVVAIEQELAKASYTFARSFPNDPFYNEVLRFITTGGKRFRPALSLIIARSFGQQDAFPHLALETFHKYLLAHDDIIDRDTMRYGNPTLHAKMTESHTGADGAHFGTSLGIIGGDLMEAMTHKIILASSLSTSTKIALEQLIFQAVEEVAWGWYDQFVMDYLPLTSLELSFERIEKSIVWVTGKYSIKLPLLFGYAAANQQPPKNIELLSDKLGALYQTGDDLIGLFGDETTTGKSNFGDILQGKKTIPMWLTFTNASAGDKNILTGIVGNKQASSAEIEEVRRIAKQSGAIDETKLLMHSYKRECEELLESMAISSQLKQFLRGFIAFIETRDR